jgi:hypothetical protein
MKGLINVKGNSMFKTIAIALTLAMAGTSPAFADAAPVAAASKSFSTAETTIGDLLADPVAKAVIDKHLPGLSDNPSMSMAAGMTLRAIQPMAGDKISVEALDAIDADFKALKPAK